MIKGLLFLYTFFPATYAPPTDTLNFDTQIVYQMTYQTDSADKSTRKKTSMVLLLNRDESLFQSLNKLKQDSVYLAEKKVRMPALLMAPVNKLNYQIWKKDNKITTYDSAFGINLQGIEQIYCYEESSDMLEWKIMEDTMSIAGMFCQRADLHFGGRDWVAWFTPDVPIADGPYKFCGLPGLIVAIADVKNHWQFQLTNIRKTDRQVVLNFQSWYEFVPASKEQLFSDRKKFQNNLIATQEAAGASFLPTGASEVTQRQVKNDILQRMAKDNNWVELYP